MNFSKGIPNKVSLSAKVPSIVTGDGKDSEVKLDINLGGSKEKANTPKKKTPAFLKKKKPENEEKKETTPKGNQEPPKQEEIPKPEPRPAPTEEHKEEAIVQEPVKEEKPKEEKQKEEPIPTEERKEEPIIQEEPAKEDKPKEDPAIEEKPKEEPVVMEKPKEETEENKEKEEPKNENIQESPLETPEVVQEKNPMKKNPEANDPSAIPPENIQKAKETNEDIPGSPKDIQNPPEITKIDPIKPEEGQDASSQKEEDPQPFQEPPMAPLDPPPLVNSPPAPQNQITKQVHSDSAARSLFAQYMSGKTVNLEELINAISQVLIQRKLKNGEFLSRISFNRKSPSILVSTAHLLENPDFYAQYNDKLLKMNDFVKVMLSETSDEFDQFIMTCKTPLESYFHFTSQTQQTIDKDFEDQRGVLVGKALQKLLFVRDKAQRIRKSSNAKNQKKMEELETKKNEILEEKKPGFSSNQYTENIVKKLLSPHDFEAFSQVIRSTAESLRTEFRQKDVLLTKSQFTKIKDAHLSKAPLESYFTRYIPISQNKRLKERIEKTKREIEQAIESTLTSEKLAECTMIPHSVSLEAKEEEIERAFGRINLRIENSAKKIYSDDEMSEKTEKEKGENLKRFNSQASSVSDANSQGSKGESRKQLGLKFKRIQTSVIQEEPNKEEKKEEKEKTTEEAKVEKAEEKPFLVYDPFKMKVEAPETVIEVVDMEAIQQEEITEEESMTKGLTVSLEKTALTGLDVFNMQQYVSMFPSLLHLSLNLMKNCLNNEDLSVLGDLISTQPSLLHLHLNLKGNKFNDEGIQSLSFKGFSVLKNLLSLHLNLSWNAVEQRAMEAIEQSCSSMKSLEQLTIYAKNTQIGKDGATYFGRLIEKLKQLSHLSFNFHRSQICQAGYTAITRRLANASGLLSLKIKARFPDSWIDSSFELGKSIRSLKQLRNLAIVFRSDSKHSLYACKFVANLVESVQTLKGLVIRTQESNIQASHLAMISGAISKNKEKLEKLEIKINQAGLGDQEALEVFKSLKRMPCLKELVMEFKKNKLKVAGASNLADILSTFKTLESFSLDLAMNPITDKGLDKITSSFKGTSSLRELTLKVTNCSLGDSASFAFLSFLPNLSSFYLRFNQNGASHVALQNLKREIMKASPPLKKLGLSFKS